MRSTTIRSSKGGPPTLVDQLRDARLKSGVKLAKLCEDAQLECSADSLCRKLADKQPLTTGEAEALAIALGVDLVWNPTRRRTA